jgi:hypothetical protein
VVPIIIQSNIGLPQVETELKECWTQWMGGMDTRDKKNVVSDEILPSHVPLSFPCWPLSSSTFSFRLHPPQTYQIGFWDALDWLIHLHLYLYCLDSESVCQALCTMKLKELNLSSCRSEPQQNLREKGILRSQTQRPKHLSSLDCVSTGLKRMEKSSSTNQPQVLRVWRI